MGHSKNFGLILILLFIHIIGYGQVQLKGKVVNAKTQKALLGVTILEKGTSNGVFTQEDGSFTIKTKSSAGILVISYSGFKSIEYIFDGAKDNIIIEMKVATLGKNRLSAGLYLPFGNGNVGYGIRADYSMRFPFLYRQFGLRLNLLGNYHLFENANWGGFGLGVSRHFGGLTLHLNGGYQLLEFDWNMRYAFFNPELSTWIRVPVIRKWVNLGFGYMALNQPASNFWRISLDIRLN